MLFLWISPIKTTRFLDTGKLVWVSKRIFVLNTQTNLKALDTLSMSSYSDEKAILVTHSSSIIECDMNWLVNESISANLRSAEVNCTSTCTCFSLTLDVSMLYKCMAEKKSVMIYEVYALSIILINPGATGFFIVAKSHAFQNTINERICRK